MGYTRGVPEKRADTILNLMLMIELFTLKRAWEGLTDEEMHWEPHAGAWGARRRSDCTTPTPIGDGEWVLDFDEQLAWAATEGRAVEPMTTIGWLLAHVGSVPALLAQRDFLGGATSAADAPFMYQPVVFATAVEAVTAMRDGWRALDRALHSADATDEALERPSVEYYGPSSGMQLTMSALHEISHHGTQVCVLRDLFRAQQT